MVNERLTRDNHGSGPVRSRANEVAGASFGNWKSAL